MTRGSDALRREALACHGYLPSSWAVRRFKHVASVREGQVDPEAPAFRKAPLYAPNHIESGTGRLLEIESTEEQGAESGKYQVDSGDLLYCKIRPALRKVALAPRAGLCSADMYPIKPGPDLDARYLFYSMLGDGFYRYSLLESARVAMPKINREALGQCVLLMPPMAEQHRISSFLDRKTAAIDELIKKKERLIELLQEKRQALITQAVTKGLDSKVPMKESRTAWIGSVPAHWDVVRVRQVAKLESGHTPSRRHTEYWVARECTIPWFTLADVWQLRGDRQERLGETAEKISPLGLANSAARLLPVGTVVLSRTASVGFSGIMSLPMATTQDFVNWICGPRIRPEFLLYVFRAMRPDLRRLVMGSVHPTIYMPDVWRFSAPVPPVKEQEAIVETIRSTTGALIKAEDKIVKQLESVREYRQALISAAVTGQLDVASELIENDLGIRSEAQAT